MKLGIELICLPLVMLVGARCGRRVTVAPQPLVAPHAVRSQAAADMLNPRRFSAAQMEREGNIWHLHGNVAVKLASSVIVYAEDAEYTEQQYSMVTHGEARMAVQPVRAVPDLLVPITDSQRLQADEIREENGLVNLHGNVIIRMPGVRIVADAASFDKASATIMTHGEARAILVKALITPPDNLGPLLVRLPVDSPGRR